VAITGGFTFGRVASMACNLGKNGNSASICSSWPSVSMQSKQDRGNLTPKVDGKFWSGSLWTRSRYIEIHAFNRVVRCGCLRFVVGANTTSRNAKALNVELVVVEEARKR
jgi:hypothetical protein